MSLFLTKHNLNKPVSLDSSEKHVCVLCTTQCKLLEETQGRGQAGRER